MKLVADESVDAPIVAALRAPNLSVYFVTETCPGIADEEVLQLAVNQQAVLLTLDKDFGELVFRFQHPHAGVILVRLPTHSTHEKARIVSEAFKNHREKFVNTFTVIYDRFIKFGYQKRRLRNGVAFFD